MSKLDKTKEKAFEAAKDAQKNENIREKEKELAKMTAEKAINHYKRF